MTCLNGWWLTWWVCFSSTAQGAVPWSREGLLDHIVEFIVTYDEVSCTARLPCLTQWHSSQLACFQPFSIVDWPYFRALLKFHRPATQEADIPHRTTVTPEILTTAERVKRLIKARYQVRCAFIPSHCNGGGNSQQRLVY